MASSSNSSAPKTIASTSSSSIQKRFKYDVFLSFRGEDTRKTIVDHLYHALKDKCIYTYKDDEKIQKGKKISDDLIKAIEDSKFYIIVFSKNYASSSWCLEELGKIMECQKKDEHTAYPIFYDVEPTEVRKQSGAVGQAFAKHEKEEAAGKWREALKEAADLAGWELKNTFDGHEAKFVKEIVQEISLELRSISFGFDEKLVGMETRVKDVVSSLEVRSDEVRMIGIKGMGGAGKTTTARAVFDNLSAYYEAKIFVENVREVSNGSVSGLKNLQEQVLSNVLNEHVTLNSVDDGKDMMKRRMCGKKVLLVLDDVDHIKQLEALAGEAKWFKPGSRILITTRDEQVLKAPRSVDVIRDIALLSDQEATSLFSRYAFGREDPLQGYEELSGKVVRYAAGLPLTVEVLGSFLCGKDMVEWEDAIERLKDIPLKETLEKLKLSYNSLEDDYQQIFLDIACILKGEKKEDAIRILESCGFRARIGLKVLEQRSLITVDGYGDLGMHDHIEEMGKNIVHREHPNEPNKHSRLWNYEELKDILADDKGTEATRCLKLDLWRGKSRIVMNGLGKMKELRYLEVNFAYFDSESDPEFDDKSNRIARIVMKGLGKMKILGCLEVFFANYDSESDLKFDDISQCFTNSLKYLKFRNYPFLYLPKTFQANNLVGLNMKCSTRMEQLWEEGAKKVLPKLKFLSLSESKLMTFDFGLTPNIETLSLESSGNLEELCMPFCCQKLKHLNISDSKLRTFDLGLTPNLETLSLFRCADFVELRVPVACPNLKILKLRESSLRSLDLELIPNLEKLDLVYCDKLVEIKAPVGCLRKLVNLDLDSCLRFRSFQFQSRCEPKVNRSSDTLYLYGQSLDSCPLHPKSQLPKIRFTCIYKEYLPSSVGNIEKLISIGLCACTDFEKFSDMICSLQCLQTLTLGGENIREFPKDLGQLECLKSLNLDGCALLEKLPEDIGRLESLESLDLSFTMIKHLPDSICMLKHLKYLNLYKCALLEKLPEDLGRLECLKKLKVSSEKIEYLPDSICMLKCLSLYVDSDLLEKLPENLGQLECLEELVVSSKKIEFLPDSICKLQCLKSLRVRWCCRLGKLPEDIGQLESLERLDLWSATMIKNLPDSICMLKRLKSLDLDFCALLEKLPEDIGQLESLEKLDLSCTKMIKHLPDSICMLKRLKSLDLYRCALLEKLPEDIGQLESLESLALSATKIKYLPDSICMLKHLSYLNLEDCALLEKLPEDLGKSECLKELIIKNTRISDHLPQRLNAASSDLRLHSGINSGSSSGGSNSGSSSGGSNSGSSSGGSR